MHLLPTYHLGLNVVSFRGLKRDQGNQEKGEQGVRMEIEPLAQLTPSFNALPLRRVHDGERLFGGDNDQSRLQRGRQFLQGRCKGRVFDRVFCLLVGDEGCGESRVALGLGSPGFCSCLGLCICVFLCMSVYLQGRSFI